MTPYRYASSAALRSRSGGFTLIELMISLTIGLLIIVTISYVYLGASRTFRALDASSRMQENARYAIDRVGYDIRMAGFTGCSYTSVANVLNDPSAWTGNLFGRPLVGYESGVSTYPTGVTALRGDALTILRADNAKEYIVATHNPPSAQLQLTQNHDLKQGEILVLTDCTHAAVFQMTNVNNNNTIKTVNHNTGGTLTPGNCTKGFGLPVNCADTNGVEYEFPAGSRIYRLSGVTYYIRNNDKGEPTLYRQSLDYDTSTHNASTTPLEVVEGVENMQIVYGVDTDATADGAVNQYVTADQVTTVAPGATDDDKWKRVLSLRISLLMVSGNNENVTTAPQAYLYNGTTTTPTDNKLRKVFTTTISVRNRL